jgi:large subunit ribosomal protein L4
VAADEIKETTGTGTPGEEPQAASQDAAAQADASEKKAPRARRTSGAGSDEPEQVADEAAGAAPAESGAAPEAADAASDTPGAAPEEKPAGDEKAATPAKKPTRRTAASSAGAKKAAGTSDAEAAAGKRSAARPPAKATAGKTAATPATSTAAKDTARTAPRGPLQAAVVDADGHVVETIDLAAERFGVAAKTGVLHLTVRAEQAARRSGTASTKTRGEVAGTTAKMYRQKGTGRARAGSVKSPVRTGGGTVFGPKPRDFSIKVNRKVARQALRMALSNRADSGAVYVARGLELDSPSTRSVHRLLVAMDIATPVLVVTHDEDVLIKSVRNLAYAQALEVRDLTTEQVLRARSLVFTEKAFAALDQA